MIANVAERSAGFGGLGAQPRGQCAYSPWGVGNRLSPFRAESSWSAQVSIDEPHHLPATALQPSIADAVAPERRTLPVDVVAVVFGPDQQLLDAEVAAREDDAPVITDLDADIEVANAVGPQRQSHRGLLG